MNEVASEGRTVILLVRPKGAGKSWVARALAESLGVHHVDLDPLILGLVAESGQPGADSGWLGPVLGAIEDALRDHHLVAVEATGAWESDFLLAAELESAGHRVIRVFCTASEEEATARLRARFPAGRMPVDHREAVRLHRRSVANAVLPGKPWDLTLDLSGLPRRADVVTAIQRLLDP